VGKSVAGPEKEKGIRKWNERKWTRNNDEIAEWGHGESMD